MAMALAQAGGGGRRGRRRGSKRPLAEINVTPMVDVMLVLLIVFMVAAPLLTVGVPIDLPQTKAKELNTESKPITVSVTPAGDIYLGDKPTSVDTLIADITAQAPGGTDERIYVRGDIYLGDKPVAIDGLVDAINAQAPNGAATDQRIYVRGDQSANYGAVMKVMGTLSAGGFSKIGLITAQTQDQAK